VHRLLLLVSLALTPAILTAQVATIDFEGIPAGTILSTVDATSLGGPVGPIGVSGTKPSTGATNVALVFDSANPTGNDFDLGTPNEDFGGPGIGDAGELGQPNQNDTALGKILVLAENLVDGNGNGLIDDPDDADEEDMVLAFDFTGISSPNPVSSVSVLSVTAIDLQQAEGELPATIFLYDGANALIASFPIGDTGNNGVKVIDTGAPGVGTGGVARMEIVLQGSGGIDSIVLLTEEPPPGGGEGCTPGFWRQAHHFDSWVGFLPGNDYETVFGVDACFTKTLYGAVIQGGGGEKALGRHAMAALLNASSDDVDYDYTVAQVIQLVQDAYVSGDFEGAKDDLEDANEAGCPLN